MKNRRIILGATLCAAVVSPLLAHEEQVISVGQNSLGSLVVDADFPQPVHLPVSIFPGITGYATGELAFHSTILDEPELDFFQLSTLANFRFVLVAKAAGVEVWNDTGSGFMNVNDTYALGPAPFDSHPIWNIVNGVMGQSYSLTMKLQDVNQIYADSAAFTITFTPEVEPPTLNLERINSQQVAISWPTNYVDWVLEKTDSLTVGTWTPVTNLTSVASSNFVVTLPADGERKFFRLREEVIASAGLAE